MHSPFARAPVVLVVAVASCALSAAVAFAPRAAHACSCAPPGAAPGIFPHNGGLAPRNTRVWILNPMATGTFELHGAGAPVEVSTTRIAALGSTLGGEIVVLTPSEPLIAGESYRVVVSAGFGGPTQQLGMFEVGSEDDRQAPPVPAIVDVEPEVHEDVGTCGETRSVNVTAEGEGLVVMRLALPGTTPDLTSVPPEGNVDFVVNDQGGGYRWGWGGPCVAWPSDSEVIALQMASFDLAGNFSGWSEPETIRRPQFSDPFIDCAVAAPDARPGGGNGSAGVVAASALAFAAWLRARRRRRG